MYPKRKSYFILMATLLLILTITMPAHPGPEDRDDPNLFILSTGDAVKDLAIVPDETQSRVTLSSGPLPDQAPGIQQDEGKGKIEIILDTGPAENLPSQSFLSAPVAAETDIVVTKTDTADPVKVGEVFQYVITVTNNGPDTAENVTLTDTLPAALEFDSGTSSLVGPPGGVCAIGITPLPVNVNCNYSSRWLLRDRCYTTCQCQLYLLVNGVW
jgi:uncharacterized repeat protein (TIGR01451 family)